MIKILITAANSDISIGIARILRLSFKEILLIGVAPDGQWPGANFFDYFHNVPLVSDFYRYKCVIEEVIKRYDINVLCPISEKEMLVFRKNKYFPIDNILINSNKILDNCLDKYETYTWLKTIGVPVLETFLFSNDSACSINKCVIKPRASAGSKNMYYVNNKILFDAVKYTLKDSLDDFIVQREVGSKENEYTCALWRFNMEFRHIILRRKLQGGLTCEAQIVEQRAISDVLEKIAMNIKENFFINVQLRLENGKPYIFEINPRFSSTVMMRHKIGFQDVLWSFLYILKMDIPSYKISYLNARLFRIAEELIVDCKKEL